MAPVVAHQAGDRVLRHNSITLIDELPPVWLLTPTTNPCMLNLLSIQQIIEPFS